MNKLHALEAIRLAQPSHKHHSFRTFRVNATVAAIACIKKEKNSNARIVQYGNDPRDRRIVVNYKK